MVLIFFLLMFNLDYTITNQMDKISSKELDKVMNFLEDFTSFPTYTTIFYTLSLFGKEREEKIVKLATISFLGGSLLSFGLKGIVNRERPNKEFTSRFNSSFPSGHMVNYFSIAHIFSKEYPKYRLYLYSFGLILGFSRIYLKKHYFTDVVAGIILGISFSEFIYQKRNYFNLFFSKI